MSVADDVRAVLAAVEVLAPLVPETVAYLRGGPKPSYFDTLPLESRSSVALRAKKARENWKEPQ